MNSQPKLITVKKRELKKSCRYEILSVRVIRYMDFDVENMVTGHKYQVSWSDKLKSLGCTCLWGTNEIGSGVIVEEHRCKHIIATRKYLSDKNANKD